MQLKPITAIFVLSLVVASLLVAGCLITTPSNQSASNAPPGADANFNVTISARQVPMIMTPLVNETPLQSGKHFVAIECSLRDNNVQNLYTNWREWKARDATGNLYEGHGNIVMMAGAYPIETHIQPGETAKGIVPFEVPTNVTIVSMRWTTWFVTAEISGEHTLTTPVK